ncbi:hypothetical protein [Ensifer soli]|uniref:hypothetical protein n=1 Tax=Ciceribacter sp. sgz301302 TaxID=3342379 RepID=UPI0035B975C4
MPKPIGMAEREAIIARELKLTIATVHNAVRRLREAGRIASSRPVAPLVTSRGLAKMILGACATLPVDAPTVEEKVGALPRASGDGAVNAETEIVDLLEEAAGFVSGDIDFRNGDVLISAEGFGWLMVAAKRLDGATFTRLYRHKVGEFHGLQRIARIPLPTIRRIAVQLLEA